MIEEKTKKTLIEHHFSKILKIIGEDIDRPGLKETPKRIAKMYNEIFRGYDLSKKPKITTFPNGADGIKYDQIITDSGYFFSQCEHHAVPFFGQYNFGYIPKKKVIGLSKVARIIDYYSAKLQVQERLGQEIVDEIHQAIKPKGIILELKARHLCKEMRGVCKINGQMTTSIVKGIFNKDLSAREEFFQLIK